MESKTAKTKTIPLNDITTCTEAESEGEDGGKTIYKNAKPQNHHRNKKC